MCAGSPLDLVQPEALRFKVAEPLLLLGKQRFANVDIRIRVKGGGHVSQIYGARARCRRLAILRLPSRCCHMLRAAACNSGLRRSLHLAQLQRPDAAASTQCTALTFAESSLLVFGR